jgi:hypothetical protein
MPVALWPPDDFVAGVANQFRGVDVEMDLARGNGGRGSQALSHGMAVSCYAP